MDVRLSLWQAKRRTLCRWFGHKPAREHGQLLHLCRRCHVLVSCDQCRERVLRILRDADASA